MTGKEKLLEVIAFMVHCDASEMDELAEKYKDYFERWELEQAVAEYDLIYHTTNENGEDVTVIKVGDWPTRW